MEPLSYAKSPLVIENIQRIELLRTQLLSLIISREDEWELRWETKLMHTFYSLSLYDLSVQKNKVITTLSSAGANNEVTEQQKEIILFREAADYVDRSWHITQNLITYEVLADLYKKIWKKKIAIPEAELEQAFMFIQKSTEHPVIQAIAAQATIYQYANIDEKNRSFSHLILMLMLYKYGWDLRGMVLIEHFFHIERAYYKELLSNALEGKNITPWLEYMTTAYVTELEESIQKISMRERDSVIAKAFKLSDRQKEILAYFTTPESTITNRQVQKMFKVSAITASRDLSKLVLQGLLYSEGKGRAVTYSKV